MKILWVSHLVPYPPKGGVLQRSYNLLREVARYHEVDLVALVQRQFLAYLHQDEGEALWNARQALSFCPSVSFCPLPQDQARFGRTGLLIGSLLSSYPYTVNWLKSRDMAALIQERVEREPYQLAHLDTFSLGCYLPQLKGVPAVMNHHNVESHMMRRRAANESNPLAKAYMLQESWKIRAWERRYGAQCAFHTTCSALDSERLLAVEPRLQGRIEEVPNGVDLDYFKPDGRPKIPGRLIFAGRLNAYPNRRAALFIARELWPLLKKALPDSSVDIIGADPPEELIRLSRQDPSIRVHGFVDDVRPFLNEAEVYLCPITDGGGTKLKMLDALAMGMAVVAHPIACEGISVSDGHDVLLAQTPDEYVAKIRLLRESADLRPRLSAAARALIVRNYGYEAIGKKLSAVYQRVAKAGDDGVREGRTRRVCT